MDPIGGINPNPRLDNGQPQQVPQQPMQPQQNMMQQAAITPPTLESLGADLSSPIQMQNNQGSIEGISAPGEAPHKGGAIKKILLILVGLIVLGGLVGGGYYLGHVTGVTKGRTQADAEYQKKQAQLQQQQAEDEDTAPEEDETELKLGDLVEPKYIEETLEGETGKQISAGDGLVLRVTNIERNFKAEDPNYKLDSSKELIKVNFLIGNIAKDKAKDISSFNFRLENSASALLTPENIAAYTDKFDTVKLDPGAQAKGSIVYAVNKDEKPLKFVREQRYRISSENREVTTKTVITVAK
jgi:hypothetical protein